jgi:hypothetical protein
MPDAISRALARFERKAASLRPGLRRAYLQGFATLREMLPESLLARLIDTGGIDRLLSDALTPAAVDRAFSQFRTAIRSGVESSGTYFMKDVPRLAPVSSGALALATPTVGIAFDTLAPGVLEAVARLQRSIMDTAVLEPVRDLIRDTARMGIEHGWGPRTTARYMRDWLPLGTNQARAIANFRRMLEEGDREALTRALRDKRFDRTLARALGKGGTGLSKAQIDRMVGAYSRNMVAFNAETISRTTALNAVKQGQHQAWQSAIGQAGIPPENVTKTWANVGDNRVREEHQNMPVGVGGETVPFSVPYSTGEMVPGEFSFNCRCRSIIRVGYGETQTTTTKAPVSPQTPTGLPPVIRRPDLEARPSGEFKRAPDQWLPIGESEWPKVLHTRVAGIPVREGLRWGDDAASAAFNWDAAQRAKVLEAGILPQREIGIVINADGTIHNGAEILAAGADPNKLSLYGAQVRALSKPGAIFHHLHPNGSSLSLADLEAVARTRGEMRALGIVPTWNPKTYTYRVSGVQAKDLPSIRRDWERGMRDMTARAEAKKAAGEFAEPDAYWDWLAEQSHQLNEELARKYGYQYTRD